MRPERRPKEVRQAELVDAALSVIATRGIAALTTRSLAEQVGLTSGAIFRHFASLDALLLAVVGRVEEVLDSTYPDETLPPRERLERFVEARSTAVGNQLGIMRLVVSEQFLLALPATASARLAACVQRTRAFVTACIHDGQRDGSFRSDVDASAVAVIVMGTTQRLALSNANPRQHAAQAQAVRGTLLVLLEPPAQRSSHGTRQRGARP